MPAILHLLGNDAIASADVVVADVLALDDRGPGGVAHVVVAGPRTFDDALEGDLAAALGPRLLPVSGPDRAGWRDLTLLDALARTVRELRARHGALALHAHGPHARSIAALVGRSSDVAVIVDAGDERPTHHILPPPTRIVFSSHGDLDRALDAGLVARTAAIAPPGIDSALPVDVDEDVAVVDVTVDSPHLDKTLERHGLRVDTRLTPRSVLRAAIVVVGRGAHLGPGVVGAVAAGIPTIAVDVPWADALSGCAAFRSRVELDLEELLELPSRRRPRPRRLPRALGRAARTDALVELYDAVVGPRISLHPPGRRRRR